MKNETIQSLKKKKKYHQKKVDSFNKKIEEEKLKETRIGFRWYD